MVDQTSGKKGKGEEGGKNPSKFGGSGYGGLSLSSEEIRTLLASPDSTADKIWNRKLSSQVHADSSGFVFGKVGQRYTPQASLARPVKQTAPEGSMLPVGFCLLHACGNCSKKDRFESGGADEADRPCKHYHSVNQWPTTAMTWKAAIRIQAERCGISLED